MFRWHRVLAASAAIALLPLASSHAYPIQVHFAVVGDPGDPVNAGLTAGGSFTYDSDIIPFGGGTVSNSVGLNVPTVSFTWDGHDWNTTNADVYQLSFEADGRLSGWVLGADINGSDCGPGPDFFVSVIAFSGAVNFVYSTSPTSGNYSGNLTGWDSAPTRIISAFTESVQGYLYALSSTGDLYVVPTGTNGGCSPLGAGQLVGNIFNNGPVPSPIISAGTYAGGFWVCLQNADVYSWCPSSGTGILAGNLFSASGVTAVGLNIPRIQNQAFPPRPNPFNPSVRIPYTLASPGRVQIQVFDVRGRLVRTVENKARAAGQYTAQWDGSNENGGDAASGTYIGRITFPDGSTAERKMTIIR